MKTITRLNLIASFLLLSSVAFGQYSPPDEGALEDIFVEIYYVSDSLDATEEDGGFLDTCSVTYRIYADMKPGYEIQAVFGNENNVMSMSANADIYNNEDRGEETGDAIGDQYLEDGVVALDSYLTMGPASDAHWGVLKEEDPDGSIVGGENNDGGFIAHNDENMDILVTDQDGLLEGEVPELTVVGLDLDVFADENAEFNFESTSGAWSVLEGVVGPTDANRVLLAQITTQGQAEFNFRLNIQLGIPADLICNHPDCHNTIQYVAELHPEDAEPGVENDNIFEHPGLTYTAEPIICDVATNIEELNTTMLNFNIYPNPVDDFFTLDVSTNKVEPLTLYVYNGLGELCFTENIQFSSSEFQQLIDVSKLASGLYTAVLLSETTSTNMKILKR